MDGHDIQTEINNTPRALGSGRGGGGRPINLPAEVIDVHETIVSGGDTSSTAQSGLQIRGQGASIPYLMGNVEPTAGTTLRWKGEEGGTMWRHEGGSYPLWTDMTFQMCDNEGGATAGIGLELSGSNAGSSPTQSPRMEDVHIIAKPKQDNTSIGLLISGKDGNDQVDNLEALRIEIRNVARAVVSDNWQAVNNSIHQGKLDGRLHAIDLIHGSLNLTNAQLNTRSTDAEAAHIQVGPQAAYLRLRDSYCETQAGDFLRLVPGSDAGSHYDFMGNVVVDGLRLNHQGDPAAGWADIKLVTGAWWGSVSITDCDLKAAGGAGGGNPTQRRLIVDPGGTMYLTRNNVQDWNDFKLIERDSG